MMVLLTVLALGMLGLSSVTLRSGSQESARIEARANARLGLMMALGELQKQMGPDQRISARAEILDTNPATLTADGVTHPHYLGVWDSWNTWLTDTKGSLSIQNTYQYGRHPSLFRQWLVSHPNAEQYQMAINDTLAPEMVKLLGPVSAGPDASNHVEAALVEVREGQELKGKYAWWVTDESLKARLDMEARTEPANATKAAIIASYTGRMGVEKMEGMTDFDTSAESLRKTISIGQAGISAERANEHFHDLSAHSLGLYTDVRYGGFKSDLNLAFESDDMPAQMEDTTLFGHSFEAPIRPMTGTLAGITPQNKYIGPMSWRQLREFYRTYRSGFSDSGTRQPLTWDSGQPETNRLLIGKEKLYQWDTMGYARQPVMLRQTWVIATSSQTNTALPGGIDYYILAIPVITLWNPYNVTLQMDSTEIGYTGAIYSAMNLRQRIYKNGVPVSDTDFPDDTTTTWGATGNATNPRRMYWINGRQPNYDITANQLGFQMKISESGSAPVVFKPGEVRIFSTNDQIANATAPPGANGRFFVATPGFNPVGATNAAVLRGLKYRIHPGDGVGQPSLALGFLSNPYKDATLTDLQIRAAPPGSAITLLPGPRPAPIVWSFQDDFENDGKTLIEDGSTANRQYMQSNTSNQDFWEMSWTGFTALNWIDGSDVESSGWLIPDTAASRAQWPSPGQPPIPVAMVSIVAKSPQQLSYETSGNFSKDFRNRGWLHAPATRMSNFTLDPTDLTRADSAYQLHFLPVNGDSEVSQYLESDGPLAYYGGGYSASKGQSHVTALSVPTFPVMNLGSFAGIRMERGQSRGDVPDGGKPLYYCYGRNKVKAHAAGAFGAGIGNGYAHPMISPTQVYTRNDMGTDDQATYFRASTWVGTSLNLCDDYWDHLFLTNEELWDSWFCSGIAPVVHNGVVTQTKEDAALAFFNNESHPFSPNHLPNLEGLEADEIADLIVDDNEKTWEFIGAHILNKGQFNVNSTSKEAWKAVLMSLAERPLAVFDGTASASTIAADAEVTLSRHTLANSDSEASGPGDEHAWKGIRKLSDAEIDKLAEEIVRQVKLRGPFLNMTEFVNRRLSNDSLGVTGALQAAIDWDEFNADYNGNVSGSGASINADYKTSDAMLETSKLPATYPHPRAATGSLYAGIPGYVMQSDILQGISSSISVRGDTFLIRAYGESIAKDGTVASKAWCEAVVQRMPEYVNAVDEPGKKMRNLSDANGDITDTELHADNLKFGRKFSITSFRWLNKDEI